jgi:hypothetical protein
MKPTTSVGDILPEIVDHGSGGSRTTIKAKQGLLRWSFEDDNGKVHTFLIPNSYVVQQVGV